MELLKNIFFNTDKLVPFAKIKISYIGQLFNESTENVFIRYGFGDKWENKTDLKMTKSELGFQTEIELINSDSFQFCFYNENEEWDNNVNKNYSFPIEKIEQAQEEFNSEISLLPTTNFNKFYMWKKKFRVNIYKAITYLPNLLLGKYKRKLDTTSVNTNKDN